MQRRGSPLSDAVRDRACGRVEVHAARGSALAVVALAAVVTSGACSTEDVGTATPQNAAPAPTSMLTDAWLETASALGSPLAGVELGSRTLEAERACGAAGSE